MPALPAQVFRFYWRCSACAAEITMKTDPKNADYSMELGATRNYEPWREKDKAVALSKAQREEEERGNAMKARHAGHLMAALQLLAAGSCRPHESQAACRREYRQTAASCIQRGAAASRCQARRSAPLPVQALENRTLDSRREMDIMSALDELQSLNSRHNHVTPEAALAAIRRSGGPPEADALALDDDDEALIRQMVQQTRSKRLDDAEPSPAALAPAAAAQPQQNGSHAADGERPGAPDGNSAANKPGSFGVRPGAVRIAVVQKRPAAAAVPAQPPKQQRTGAASPEGAGLAGLGTYGSDDSS